jgi:hypothetical protein
MTASAPSRRGGFFSCRLANARSSGYRTPHLMTRHVSALDGTPIRDYLTLSDDRRAAKDRAIAMGPTRSPR